ncbi:MAG: YIP1 family protein [Clostridia bacterium]|nr:YIP1 family protein [Clostridia bacterium]
MKNKKFRAIFVLAICMITLATALLPIYAAAYSTYTYSIDGTQLASPDAYTPLKVYDSDNTGILAATGFELTDPRDMTVDVDGNIYICDVAVREVTDASGKTKTEKCPRLVVLDKYYNYMYQIKNFTNDMGVSDSFNGISGCCVTEKKLYIADTDNARIVVFNRENNGRNVPTFDRIIEAPSDDVFPEGSIYKPVAVASDDSHIYVVSNTTFMGIIAMDMSGEFQGFIGAQKVSVNMLNILIRFFQTAEQRARSANYVSTEYNNITIDSEGFIYVTTSSIKEGDQQKAINNRSTASTYAPVKKLNTAGDDIMNRNGFYPPSGEVKVANVSYNAGTIGASRVIDVAVGPEKTWSIIDEKRQRVFTYDKDGNLLFAFGDSGKQLGNLVSIEAVAYQGSNMLLLDKSTNSFTVYSRTEYGNLIITALANDNARLYDKAVYDYENILQRNINFDTAYIGIAKSLYRGGDYEGAMEQYSFAYNTSGYSNAFKMYRKDLISKWIILVPIIVVGLVLALWWFFKACGKLNAKTAVTSGKRTYVQELAFAFHLIFHPFDGFWDLKHEKRGSIRGALTFLALAILASTYQSVGRSYMYNPRGVYSSIGAQALSILVPVTLWVASNWCLTTLFDGEGSAKDILIATGYSFAPMPFFIVVATVLTHILSSSESGIINLIISVSWVWVGLLIFFGIMVTHDYSILKNVLTTVGTIAGMAFIMFLCILFFTLISDIIGLISTIITEITYRM